MSATWDLNCPWCEYKVIVAMTARRGGEDAADAMKQHVLFGHHKTWHQFLWESE